MDLSVIARAKIEPGSTGLAIEARGMDEGIFDYLLLGFNLDEFGSIQTQTCTLPFTYAEILFALPLGCDKRDVDMLVRWNPAGFSELSLSTPTIGEFPLAVSLPF